MEPVNRYATIWELMSYLHIGRNLALEFGEQAGAKIALSAKTVRYDLDIIDRYIATL